MSSKSGQRGQTRAEHAPQRHLRVVSIVGVRPEWIKAAAVSRALALRAGIEEIVVDTGQHYDDALSRIFLEELDLPQPEHCLRIGSGPHGQQTARMLEAIEAVLLATRPDVVLVAGDTNSTLAGALAASKLQLPLAHVEAGLRSFNRRMPEEHNRVVVDHLADILLAPTRVAVENLRHEGIPPERIVQVGDVMLDTSLHYAERAAARSTALERLALTTGHYVIATIHRAENTDNRQRLAALAGGLAEIARESTVVLPLHPRTEAALQEQGLRDALGEVRVTAPVGYLDMITLVSNASLVATDSGGLQKEAYFFGGPCATLRDETEWVELLEAGWNRLVPPTDAAAVARGVREASASKPTKTVALYGDGHAAERIADELLQRVAAGKRDSRPEA